MLHILLVDLGTPRDEISEALGVETLAAYAVDKYGEDINLDVRSIEIDNQGKIDNYLQQTDYDMVGLSTKIRTWARFEQAMTAIKKYAPCATVVIGDILGTYAFEEVLSLYPSVICVRGEGEYAFQGLIGAKLEAHDGELNLEGIKNLAYIKNGEIVTSRDEPVDVKNALPPLRLLTEDVLRQNGIARLEGSRGCAYSLCEFCGTIEKYNGPGWRPFSIDFIINELAYLSKMGFNSPYFTDEDFVGDDPDRLYRLADAIEKAKADGRINTDLDFYVNMRANSVMGIGIGGRKKAVRLLKRLKEVGLREVFIGVESGCKEQLGKRYKKGTTKQHNIDAIRTLYDLGLEVDLGFIFFDKDSTLEDAEENLEFIFNAGIENHDSQLVKRVRIEPRTPLGNKYKGSNPSAKVDMHLVEFPYLFTNPEVAVLYKAFEKWQAGDLDVIYNLQSLCRGEVPEKYSREGIKKIVGAYRRLDIEFTKQLVAVLKNGNPNPRSEIENVTAQLQTKRDVIDKTYINRIKWLDSNFRRFEI